LRSEYFKAARAGAPPQGEEEAADLALFSGSAKGSALPAAAKKTAANKSLAKAVNLVADADDDLRGGAAGGFGVFRDGGREPPPPSSEAAVAAARASAGGVKAAAAKYAAREVLANLNHHAEVVLRGRPSQPVTDARSAALAAAAQEDAGGAAGLCSIGGGGGDDDDGDVVVVLDDLREPEEVKRRTLTLRDESAYFRGAAAAAGKAAGTNANAQLAAAAAAATSGGKKRKAGGGGGDDDEYEPSGFDVEALKRVARFFKVEHKIDWGERADEDETATGAGGKKGAKKIKSEPAEGTTATAPTPTPTTTKSLRNGVHHANAVVWEPVTTTNKKPRELGPLVDPAQARKQLDAIAEENRRAKKNKGWTRAEALASGAFYTLVPIRPRSRGERRSLRTLPGASLRPPLAFNPRPRCLSTPSDAFELHPDVRLYGTALSHRRRPPRRRRGDQSRRGDRRGAPQTFLVRAAVRHRGGVGARVPRERRVGGAVRPNGDEEKDVDARGAARVGGSAVAVDRRHGRRVFVLRRGEADARGVVRGV
jgi:hypothetical protein